VASNLAIMKRLAAHWPEYATEALCLALFMLSAAAVATLLQHPSSPIAAWSARPVLQRLPMGIAMGLTCITLIYSPLGMRSGAHMNPAVTLTFLRLGKIAPADAAAYVAAQFLGGGAGIVIATLALGGLPAHPAVNYVATLPGPGGAAVAFAAEMAISFLMMSVVLAMSNTPRVARYTGLAAGVLVATYITFEAPASGMSMNPARTLGSNVLAATLSSLWIYFTAPVIGMLLAGESYARWRGPGQVRCAKLHHPQTGRCIFDCGHKERSA
jgi:aquaporin Z